MKNPKTTYTVINRSASMVGYNIPEMGIRRLFNPGEPKTITFEELEKLTYQPGGQRLINDYFLIKNEEVLEELNVPTEPEYFMTKDEVIELIRNGSLDAWLDCLDFAPVGVIEMVKSLSVEVPLNDYEKRKTLREKTGFDVDAAIKHMEEERAEEKAPASATGTKERRVKATEEKAPEAPARRTVPKYNVVSK